MCVCVYMSVFEEVKIFYGLFPLGRHACGDHSQLDMHERFLFGEQNGGRRNEGKEKGRKNKLSVDWEEKPCYFIHDVFLW